MTDVAVQPQVTTGPIPYSEKVYREIEAPGGVVMKVPFRRINLTTGEHFDVYDTSGPYTDAHADIDLHRGLPPRPGVVRNRGTQLQYARRRDHPGDGVRRRPRGPRPRAGPRRGGRRPDGHPGQHQPPRARADGHRQGVPGARSTPTSATRPSPPTIDNELAKLTLGHPLGADTVMDLSTGGNIDAIRQAIIAQLAGADRHRADLPGPAEGRRRPGRPDLGAVPRHRDRAGQAGRRLHDPPRRGTAASTSR